MAGDRKLQLLITADARQAQRALGNLERTAGKSGKGIESSIGGIQRGLVGMGTGALAVGAFKAFEDSERVGRQLEQVIKSTGGAAHVTAGQVDELVQALSKKGGVDDEELTAGATQLLQYKNIANQVGKNNDIFNQATKAAADYSARTGKDAVAANTLLGKSLSAPIESIGILRKAGIRLNEEQIERIKTGDLLTGQQIILAEFEKRYGGALEAGATTSGKARVAVDNMGESVGKVLAPALGTAADKLGTLAAAFSELPQFVQTATVGIGATATAAVIAGPRVAEFAGTMASAAKTAKTWASDTSAALDGIAKTRGVSKTTAGVQALRSSVMGMSPAMVVGGAASVGLGLGLYALAENAKIAERRAMALESAVSDLRTESDRTGKTIEEVFVNGQLVDSFAKNKTMFDKYGISITELRDITTASKKEQTAWVESLDLGSKGNDLKLLTTLDLLSEGYRTASAETKAAKGATKELAGETDKTAGSLKTLNEKLVESTAKSDRASEAEKRQADKLIGLAAAAKDAEDRIRGYYDAQSEGLNKELDYEEAIDNLTTVVKENGFTLDKRDEKGRAVIRALEAEATAARELALSHDDGTKSILTYRDSLVEQARQLGATDEQILIMLADMGLTDTEIHTEFTNNVPAKAEEVKTFKDAILATPGSYTTWFYADTRPAMEEIGKLIQTLGSQVPVGMTTSIGPVVVPGTLQFPAGKAKGGPVRAGGFNLVGENGPELVQWGSSGTVIPAPRTRDMLSGGGSCSCGGSTTTVVQLDSAEIARHTITSQNRSTRSTGRSPVLTSISSVTR